MLLSVHIKKVVHVRVNGGKKEWLYCISHAGYLLFYGWGIMCDESHVGEVVYC